MGQLAEDKALEYFNSHNCCQAVLRTVLEEKGLMFDEAVYVGSVYWALTSGFCVSISEPSDYEA